jgi:hypothetical protein
MISCVGGTDFLMMKDIKQASFEDAATILELQKLAYQTQ